MPNGVKFNDALYKARRDKKTDAEKERKKNPKSAAKFEDLTAALNGE